MPLPRRVHAPLAVAVVGASLLAPAVAFASGGGAGQGTLTAAFLSPVAAVAAIVCGLVLRFAESPTVRHRVGMGALVVMVLVALLQTLLIGSDVRMYGVEAFPTKLAWLWAVVCVVLSAAALALAVSLVRG